MPTDECIQGRGREEGIGGVGWGGSKRGTVKGTRRKGHEWVERSHGGTDAGLRT